MLKRRLITFLPYLNGELVRTRRFVPDYTYTSRFIDTSLVDEIIAIDISPIPSLDTFLTGIEAWNLGCHAPVTLGGGVRTLDDAWALFDNGADKIALGRGAPLSLISKIAAKYGTQAVVYILSYRPEQEPLVPTRVNYFAALGVGEIVLQPIERDGALTGGFDCQTIRKSPSPIPLIALGGGGAWADFAEAYHAGADGVCTSNIFHFTESAQQSLRAYLHFAGIAIRPLQSGVARQSDDHTQLKEPS